MKSKAGLLLLTILTGCGGGETPQPNSPSGTNPSQAEAKDQVAAEIQVEAKVPLEIKSWDETQALIAQNKGKIVVLDVWSLT